MCIYYTTLPFDLGWLGFRRVFSKLFSFLPAHNVHLPYKKKCLPSGYALENFIFHLGLKTEVKKKIFDMRSSTRPWRQNGGVSSSSSQFIHSKSETAEILKEYLERFYYENPWLCTVAALIFTYVSLRFSRRIERMYLSLSLSTYIHRENIVCQL